MLKSELYVSKLYTFFLLALQFLRQKENVDDEIAEMKREAKSMIQDKTSHYTLLNVIKNKRYRLPLILVVLLAIAVSGTGITAVRLLLIISFSSIVPESGHKEDLLFHYF